MLIQTKNRKMLVLTAKHAKGYQKPLSDEMIVPATQQLAY